MRKLPDNEVRKIRTYRITDKEYEVLNKLCIEMGITFGQFLRDALAIHYQKCRKERTKQYGLFKFHNTKDIIGYDIDM